MKKSEFQKIVKNKLTELGFINNGINFHKIIDDDYLVGVCLDHNPYCKGYFIEFGVIYLPDEKKLPFDGFWDWDCTFLFTVDPCDDLKKYDLEELWSHNDSLTECFEYDIRTPEDLEYQLDLNLQKRLSVLDDKTFVLEYYHKNLDELIRLPVATISKLLNHYEYDREQVNTLRKEAGCYTKCDF